MNVQHLQEALLQALARTTHPHKTLESFTQYLAHMKAPHAYSLVVTTLFKKRLQKMLTTAHATLTVAYASDEKTARENLSVTGVHIVKDAVVHIDSSLIGGYVYEHAHVLTDTSHKKQLLNLYHSVASRTP
jgi:F0F1-type ATP synthase delta subunit